MLLYITLLIIIITVVVYFFYFQKPTPTPTSTPFTLEQVAERYLTKKYNVEKFENEPTLTPVAIESQDSTPAPILEFVAIESQDSTPAPIVIYERKKTADKPLHPFDKNSANKQLFNNIWSDLLLTIPDKYKNYFLQCDIIKPDFKIISSNFLCFLKDYSIQDGFDKNSIKVSILLIISLQNIFANFDAQRATYDPETKTISSAGRTVELDKFVETLSDEMTASTSVANCQFCTTKE